MMARQTFLHRHILSKLYNICWQLDDLRRLADQKDGAASTAYEELKTVRRRIDELASENTKLKSLVGFCFVSSFPRGWESGKMLGISFHAETRVCTCRWQHTSRASLIWRLSWSENKMSILQLFRWEMQKSGSSRWHWRSSCQNTEISWTSRLDWTLRLQPTEKC